MRLLFLSIFLIVNLLGAKDCKAQTGTFIWTNGAPTTNPGASGARFAVDRATFRWYEWVSGTSWVQSGDRIQRISGCAAPAYTPTIHNAYFVVNGCTEPEFYYWNGTAWKLLNGGGGATYTAGSGIAISGTNVISNTAPNVNQTISTSGAAGNITLSNGGGTLNLNVNDADANPTNEIQNLSLTGQALGISSGTGVNLPVVGVAAGEGIGVSSSAGVVTVTNNGLLSESDGTTIDFTTTEKVLTGEVQLNSLDSTHIKIGGVALECISQDGASTGYALIYDGSNWTPSEITSESISWPLLAPNIRFTTQYSFEGNQTGGLEYASDIKLNAGGNNDDIIPKIYIQGSSTTTNGGGEIYINAGNGATVGGDVLINAGSGQTSNGGNVIVFAGTSDTGQGGGVNISAGASTTEGAGGAFIFSSGSGAGGGPGGDFNMSAGGSLLNSGGNFIMQGGQSENLTGGNFSMAGGQGGVDGGSFTLSGGYGVTGVGGNLTFFAGIGGTSEGELKFQSSFRPIFLNTQGSKYKLLTTTQRNAIPTTESLLLWNTTTKSFNIHDGTSWHEIPKIIKASATLNFPSTPVHSSSDLTVTVAGAAVGDVVTVAPGLAAISAGSCFTAWVSAANTVTVRFNHYHAGGATDPVSAVFNIIVTKF